MTHLKAVLAALTIILGLTLLGSIEPAQATQFGASKPADLPYRVDAHRVYLQAPTDWDKVTQPSVVSFKLPPRAVNSGRYDGMLYSWFRSAPNYRIWYVYWHEPENDFTTNVQQRAYRNAWRHIVTIERSTGRNKLSSATLFMSFDFRPSVNRNPADWYPGNKFIDVIGFDGFNWWYYREYRTPGEIYGPGYRWARAHNKPYACGEWGSAVINNNVRARARWIKQTGHWFADRNAAFASYWNSELFALNDRPSKLAYKQVVGL